MVPGSSTEEFGQDIEDAVDGFQPTGILGDPDGPTSFSEQVSLNGDSCACWCSAS